MTNTRPTLTPIQLDTLQLMVQTFLRMERALPAHTGLTQDQHDSLLELAAKLARMKDYNLRHPNGRSS